MLKWKMLKAIHCTGFVNDGFLNTAVDSQGARSSRVIVAMAEEMRTTVILFRITSLILPHSRCSARIAMNRITAWSSPSLLRMDEKKVAAEARAYIPRPSAPNIRAIKTLNPNWAMAPKNPQHKGYNGSRGNLQDVLVKPSTEEGELGQQCPD